MKKIIPSLIVFLASFPSLSAQHDAHEHGIAELHIYVSEQEVEMELHMPGADFIGFEHSELSEEEEHIIHEKIELIENHEDLVRFRLAWFRKAEQELVEVHEDHDENDDHGEHEAHDEHAEYLIEMHYSFEDRKYLETADFSGLFSQFSTLEEIDWILITDSGQEAGLISRSEPRIRFR